VELAPSSFELLSPRNVARQGLELLSNAAHTRRFASVVTAMQSHLRDASVPVLVKEHGHASEILSHRQLSRSQRRWLGQLALELYFAQLFRSEVAVIDLWPTRLGVDAAGEAVWAPRPFYLRWDPSFRQGVRNIYAGFFLDRTQQFELGVRQLGLGDRANALVEHFGSGNQRSVRFGPEMLRKTLQSMVDQRSTEDTELHPNFAAFGLCLVALHELLGSLNLAFDVRAAFMRTYPGDPSQR
jgi:hypothetical protein